MSLFMTSDGNTPLSPDELKELIPNLATKGELNEWERENILQARDWADRERSKALDIASDEYIRKLHRRMFDATWKWAGQYRKTEKNIGVPVHEIRDQLIVLAGDVRYWMENETYTADEIAIRFHHRLVQIHPFPNGNGRHGRLIADILVVKLGGICFSWGAKNLGEYGEARKQYLRALRAADQGDIQPLLAFAHS
jgi:Fic-DOC domain mobile mystery protein B